MFGAVRDLRSVHTGVPCDGVAVERWRRSHGFALRRLDGSGVPYFNNLKSDWPPGCRSDQLVSSSVSLELVPVVQWDGEKVSRVHQKKIMLLDWNSFSSLTSSTSGVVGHCYSEMICDLS